MVQSKAADGYTFSSHAPAGWWRRFFAWLMDATMVGVPSFLLLQVIGLTQRINREFVGLDGEISQQVTFYAPWYSFVIAFSIVGVGYYIYFHTSSGQTVGKKALGIKVVDNNGGPCDLRRALIRFGVQALLFLAFVVPGVIDGLWATWDRNRQTLHDKIARTMVISV